jgi:hypothetical protein
MSIFHNNVGGGGRRQRRDCAYFPTNANQRHRPWLDIASFEIEI